MPQTMPDLIFIAASIFGTLLLSILGFGVSRIFAKLDSIAKKFEEIAEGFRKIYVDIHHAAASRCVDVAGAGGGGAVRAVFNNVHFIGNSTAGTKCVFAGAVAPFTQPTDLQIGTSSTGITLTWASGVTKQFNVVAYGASA